MKEPWIDPRFQACCRLGFLEVSAIDPGSKSPSLREEIAGFVRRRHTFFAGRPIADIPGILEARELFQMLGLRTSKFRPRSEIFLRRIVRGKDPPQFLDIIDLANYCSAELAMPICAYDLDVLAPPIAFRPGEKGEASPTIRRPMLDLEGLPILSDNEGFFGGPFADSKRSMITNDSCSALVVWFHLASYPAYALRADMETFAQRLVVHNVGRPGSSLCLPA